MAYKQQIHQQSNEWGYASTINQTIDNVDAIVGGDTLKESINSASTRIDSLQTAVNQTLDGVNQTLQQTQTNVNNTLNEYVNKMETLKAETESDVATVVQAINKVKDTTGDKANLYAYFNNDAGNERRNLVQTANKTLDIIGYNSQTNRSIEDLITTNKTSIVNGMNSTKTELTQETNDRIAADNAIHAKIGELNNLTTADKSNIVNGINELDREIGDLSTLPAQIKQGTITGTLNKINDLLGNLGNLISYDTTNIVLAINSLKTALDGEGTIRGNEDTAINNRIGPMNNLTTADKTNLVSSINEIDREIGSLTALPTANKSTLVGSIGELSATTANNIATKQDRLTAGTGITLNGANISVDKTALNLNLVDNVPDADKPISTATQTALDLKADSSALAQETAARESGDNYIENDLIGDLTALTTTDKTTLVEAVNSLHTLIGIGTLDTTAQTLVEAINELKASIDALSTP